MNKKGIALSLETIIIFLIIIVVALAVLFGFFYPKFKEGSSSVSNLQEGILEGTKDFGNIGKSFLLEEKEKCLKGKNNIDICLNLGNCFYGKLDSTEELDSTEGCFSCLDDKYFKFKQCESYNILKIFNLGTKKAKLVCKNNPCGFVKLNNDGGKSIKC